MDLSVPENKSDVRKHIFNLKPVRRDGLVVNVHHASTQSKIRFIHCCFDFSGNILASADNDGNIFFVDFLKTVYWSLPKAKSCSVLKFSSLNCNEILIGECDGTIRILDFRMGHKTAKLLGHSGAVMSISYAENKICLTASQFEAILWNLKDKNRLQVLNLEKDCKLRYAAFIPVSHNILTCFHDDVIQLWKKDTFESIKQIQPSTWSNHSIKSLAFTTNGRMLIVAGYIPKLAFYDLKNEKLSKTVALPEDILTIRSIDFTPQSFDGGCHKILVILSGQGVIYFYEMERNIIISQLKTTCEIIKFECSLKENYVACVLCTGEVEIYNVLQFIDPPPIVRAEKAQKLSSRAILRSCRSKMGIIKNQINEVLDMDKLKMILKEYGEFPNTYRMMIWEKLLQLPNNSKKYNSIINHVTVVAFENLYDKYPLESKTTIKSLRNLLNNLVTWCSFFSHVEYLPVLTFPFVKVFQNKPIACFEAVCTILVNWCQHWFEYFPLPPVNVLAIVENILLEHDPELIQFYNINDIKPNIYAWPLLETVFSEVLTSAEWLQLWDHVLTNEPSFLLCAVASYNILQRSAILSIETDVGFNCFYRNQNPLDTKKFISKTYFILINTSGNVHPRQYLDMFKALDVGKYPEFFEYPKTLIDYETKEKKNLKRILNDLESGEVAIMKKKVDEWKKVRDVEVEEVENTRLREMEKKCMERLLAEQEAIKNQQCKLQILRNELITEEKKIMDATLEKLHEQKTKKQETAYEFLMDKLELSKLADQHEVHKIEDDLLVRYSELLKHKYGIEQMLLSDEVFPKPNIEQIILQRQQQTLAQEIAKVRKSLKASDYLKKLNIQTGVAAMDNLIKHIELELANELSQRNLVLGEGSANFRVAKLQSEAKALENEIDKLRTLLSKIGKGYNKKESTSSATYSSFLKNTSNNFPGKLEKSKEQSTETSSPRYTIRSKRADINTCGCCSCVEKYLKPQRNSENIENRHQAPAISSRSHAINFTRHCNCFKCVCKVTYTKNVRFDNYAK